MQLSRFKSFKKHRFLKEQMRFDCAQAFRALRETLTFAKRAVFFRLAEPPDKIDFHFISLCGAKLYEVLTC